MARAREGEDWAESFADSIQVGVSSTLTGLAAVTEQLPCSQVLPFKDVSRVLHRRPPTCEARSSH